MKKTTNDRVLWAIEFSPGEKSLRNKAYQAIRAFLKDSDIAIEPVAVIHESQLALRVEPVGSAADEYAPNIEAMLEKKLRKLKDERLLPPTLLVKSHPSYRAGVDVLLDYANTVKAKAIVLLTHNRKTIARMLVGSFAETLVLKSQIPIFIVSPAAKIKKVSRIFFPTDLSNASRAAFDKILSDAKRLNAKIHLYYKFDYLIPETVTSLESSPKYLNYLERDIASKERLISNWVKRAIDFGVDCEMEIDRSTLYIADGILNAAKKCRTDLIAMASHSGHFTSLLIGSVARSVVRAANVPVWVIHPDVLEPFQQKTEAKKITQSVSPSAKSSLSSR